MGSTAKVIRTLPETAGSPRRELRVPLTDDTSIFLTPVDDETRKISLRPVDVSARGLGFFVFELAEQN